MLPRTPRLKPLPGTLLAIASAATLMLLPVEAGTRNARSQLGTNASGLQEDFYIQSLNITSKRQGGSTFDLFIAVSYDPAIQAGAGKLQYPDYRLLIKLLGPLQQPSDAYPEQVYWEVLVQEMVKQLLSEPGIDGASVQLRVHPRCDVVQGDSTPRHLWRAAMASGGDAPILAFVPSLDASTCKWH